MENDNDLSNNKVFQTPVQNKRQKTLGIRYSSIRTISKTPISEIKKINNSSRKFANDYDSPKTPLSTSENIQSESKSTGHLPAYSRRLSLSRKVLRKKRLEFTDSVESKTNAKQVTSKREISAKADVTNDQEAKKFCDDKQISKETIEDEKHKQKVDELKKLIAIWKEGFRKALDDLSNTLDPPREKTEILELLNIPAQMINYT